MTITKNEDLGQYQKQLLVKMTQIIVLGLLFAVIAYWLGMKFLSVGILAGVPLGIFNLYLVMSTINSYVGNARKAQVLFMRRFLYRLIISFTALIVSLVVDVQFMLGVVTGLTLQVLVHIIEGLGAVIFDRKG